MIVRNARGARTRQTATRLVVAAALVTAGLVSMPQARTAGATPAMPAAGRYVALDPARVLDTRTGLGAAKGAVPAGRTLALQVGGHGGVPTSGVSSVMLTVTVTGATGVGYVQAYADGLAAPTASNLNVAKDQTVSTLLISKTSASGQVDLRFTGTGTTHLIADVSGYYTAPGQDPAGFTALDPARVLDTRTGLGAAKGAVPAGRTLALQVGGHGGVPTSGVSSVMLTVTVTGATGVGYVQAYADGLAAPTASNLNVAKDQTVSTLLISKTSASGQVDLRFTGTGTTHLIADVSGYYTAPGQDPAGFTALDPARVLDTRTGLGAAKGAVPAGRTLALQVGGHGGVPTSGVSSVMLTVTVTGATGVGYVQAYADGLAAPTASNLNVAKGQTVSTLLISKTSASGQVDLRFTGTGTTHLIADVSGYYGSPSNQLSWTRQSTVQPIQGGLVGLSCPSASFCVAIDERGNVVVFDGQGWTAHRIDPGERLTTVACSSPGWCVVGDNRGDVFTYDGTTWSDPQSLSTGSISALSCVSATFCAGGTSTGQGLTFDGATWTVTGSITPSARAMTSISCVSSSYCVYAGGGLGTYNSSGWAKIYRRTAADRVSCATTTFCITSASANGDVAVYDGSTESGLQVVDPNTEITALVCTSSTYCLAGDITGHSLSYDGTHWSSPDNFDNGAITGLACPTATGCIGVAGNGNAHLLIGDQWGAATVADAPSPSVTSLACPSSTSCFSADTAGQVARFDGVSWSAPRPVDPGAEFTGIACPSDTFCAAVDTAGNAATFDGTSWSVPQHLSSSRLVTVACPSATFCMAIDYAGTPFTFDGSHWRAASTSVSQRYVSGLSCPTTTFCAVVDLGGYARTYDGRSWSAPAAVNRDEQLASVSCVSAWFCMAVSYSRHAYEFDGAGWSRALPVGQAGSPELVSCTSVTFCVSAGAYVTSYWNEFDGNSWTVSHDIPGWTPDYPGALACSTDAHCTVVGQSGQAASSP